VPIFQIVGKGYQLKLRDSRRFLILKGDAVRDVARSVPPEELAKPVDSRLVRSILEDGTMANERAKWLPGLLEGKPRRWFLSMAVWHTAEHLLGGVVCVRRVSGIPIGL
jgi:hypothetical protein